MLQKYTNIHPLTINIVAKDAKDVANRQNSSEKKEKGRTAHAVRPLFSEFIIYEIRELLASNANALNSTISEDHLLDVNTGSRFLYFNTTYSEVLDFLHILVSSD